MHKHNGVCVVAWKPGQPFSQLQSDAALCGLDDFTTKVVHQMDGEHGIAANLNLYDEAEALVQAAQDEGFEAAILQGPWHGWVVADD